MKRIALLLLLGFSFVACTNEVIIDPNDPNGKDPKDTTITKDSKGIALKIHVPPGSISTYANEDATVYENGIDSIFVYLYQSNIPIDTSKFSGADLVKETGHLDSIIKVAYEIDKISGGPLKVEVFANHRKPVKIAGEISHPQPGPLNTYFFMSDSTGLRFENGVYIGDIHLVRNVAKLRVLVTKNNPVFPSDMVIRYDQIKIEVINYPDSTTAFGGQNIDLLGIGYSSFTERLRNGTPGLPGTPGATYNVTDGGLIDSLYMYENRRNNYTTPTDRRTYVKVTIPTESPTEGNKITTVTKLIQTTLTGLEIRRNYIYTLNIVVKALGLDPLVTLDVLPWKDVPVEGSIHGTYLTLSGTEIVFNSAGEASIEFCSDAQAIYFDFSEFNANNTAPRQLGQAIKPVGIDTSLTNHGGYPLAPAGFKDAQILLDKQHCGTFGFKLDLSVLTDFPNVTFSGKICLRAGNIVQCLTFPARLTAYDAHFIVGEPLFPGESFTHFTSTDPWLHASPNKLYISANDKMTDNFASPGVPLYLHLDENLTTADRTGSITFTKADGSTKKIDITQLHALRVGRFGYGNTSSLDDSIYSAPLFTEQLHEFTTMPIFSASNALPNNALYNGRFTAINFSITDTSYYNNASFDYHASAYPAINYCAYKNRGSGPNGKLLESDIKWYLPAQAQLLAMWISYESYKSIATSDFYRLDGSGGKTHADIFWSSTSNEGYPHQAQLVNFRFGNVGHFNKVEKYWARCVRDSTAASTNAMIYEQTDGTYRNPLITFSLGMPAEAITSETKVHNNGIMSGDENSTVNKKLYHSLRIAKYDLNSGAPVPWSHDVCSSYSEPYDTPPLYTWRLPTQRELQAIWILQHDIRKVCLASGSNFELLSNDYYWSGTDVSTTTDSKWIVFGTGSRNLIGGSGNAPHQLKTATLKVRCVMQTNY